MAASAQEHPYDVVIVGAGFAGLYLLHKLRALGFSVTTVEAGSEVGGTWFWNRYPGARCDVESCEYQLGFPEELQREWTWSERYAAQPEIESYLNFVANRLDLRRDIHFGERVMSSNFDSSTATWTLRTSSNRQFEARFCIMATGCLSVAQTPDFPGLTDFAGTVYHTGQWPSSGVDFSGKRVAVIGTGSSGVQVIPMIAEQAEHLFVMQRTPNFVFPAFNRPLKPGEADAQKKQFPELRRAAMSNPSFSVASFNPVSALAVGEEEREAVFEQRWQDGGGFGFLGAFSDLLLDAQANEYAADFVRRKISSMIDDPELAERLIPRSHPLGTKRIALGTNYYETFLRSNVTLIDVRADPIEKLTAKGLQCRDTRLDVDAIVFATGFDAVTGALTKIDFTGPAGRLKTKWEAGARTYLGLMTAGFPNLFFVTGPGSPSVLSNVVASVESDSDWIIDCLTYLRNNQIDSIEASEEAECEWVDHVQLVANMTLYPAADSWYMGANIPGKPRLFLPYVGGANNHRERARSVAAAGYLGFNLARSPSEETRLERTLPTEPE